MPGDQNRPKAYCRLAGSKSRSSEADVELEVDVGILLDELGRAVLLLGPVVALEADGQEVLAVDEETDLVELEIRPADGDESTRS